jgi:NADPH:quinone reductase-like Zn-dependent oxidoreductase
VLDRVFPVADIQAAHVYLETSQSVGKVVLDFS